MNWDVREYNDFSQKVKGLMCVQVTKTVISVHEWIYQKSQQEEKYWDEEVQRLQHQWNTARFMYHFAVEDNFTSNKIYIYP